MSLAIDKLASLFENGELQAATDPAAFIVMVCDELDRLRKLVDAAEVALRCAPRMGGDITLAEREACAEIVRLLVVDRGIGCHPREEAMSNEPSTDYCPHCGSTRKAQP